MCFSPYIRPNPNHGSRNPYIMATKDVDSAYISVPCGTCKQCRSLYQTYLHERCQLMSVGHDIYFGTLTYRNSTMRHTEDIEHLDGTVRNYMYADISDFQKMMKRLRKTYLPGVSVKYLCVTEYGGRTHRPHFHFLLFVPNDKPFIYYDKYNNPHNYMPTDGSYSNDINRTLTFTAKFFAVVLHEWRRNTSRSTKKPVWEPLCKYIIGSDGRSTFDFHYVRSRPGKPVSSVSKYVTKYVLKFDSWFNKFRQALYMNLSPDDYKSVWSLVRPRLLVSKNFGTGPESRSYVNKGIDIVLNSDLSQRRFVFIDMETGRLLPLAPILRKKIVDDDTSMRQKALELV